MQLTSNTENVSALTGTATRSLLLSRLSEVTIYLTYLNYLNYLNWLFSQGLQGVMPILLIFSRNTPLQGLFLLDLGRFDVYAINIGQTTVHLG